MLGLYDSGIGGLTILKELLKQRPTIKFQYFADTQALPLGDKSFAYIQKRAKLGSQFLFQNQANLNILACNTASVSSIKHLQQTWLPKAYPSKQILSITTPLVQFYSQKLNHLKEDLGLILFTQKTCESGFYQQEFEAKGFEKLSYLPCTGLADIIETQQQAKIELFLRNYLDKQGIKPQKYSYLILACTHYELILKNLKTIFYRASVLPSSRYIAAKILNYIDTHPQYKISQTRFARGSDSKFKNKIFYTGSVDSLQKFNYGIPTSQFSFQRVDLPCGSNYTRYT